MESDKYYPVNIVFSHTIKFNYRIALTAEQNTYMRDKDIENAALRELNKLTYEEKMDLLDPSKINLECEITRDEPIGRDELMEEFVPSNAAKELIKKMMEG